MKSLTDGMLVFDKIDYDATCYYELVDGTRRSCDFFPVYWDAFWWTGALFWCTILVLLVATILLITWDVIGGLFYACKIKWRSNSKGTFKQFMKLWLNVSVDNTPYVTSDKTGEVIYRPWPWLSKKARDKEEKEIAQSW